MLFFISYSFISLALYRREIASVGMSGWLIWAFPLNIFALLNLQATDFLSISHLLIPLLLLHRLIIGIDIRFLLIFLYAIVILLISLLSSNDISVQFINNFAPYMLLASLFIVINSGLRKEFNIDQFISLFERLGVLSLLLISIGYIVGFILYQPLFFELSDINSGRLVGPFVDASILCAFALLVISVSGIIGIAIGSIAIVLAGGDGALIVVTVILFLRGLRHPATMFSMIFFATFFLSVLFFLQEQQSDLLPSGVLNVLNKVLNILYDPSALVGKRAAQIDLYYELMKYPQFYIYGTGFGSFNELYSFKYGVSQSIHNSFLQFAMNFGLFNSLLLLIIFVSYLWVYAIRGYNRAVLLMLISMIIYGQAHNVLKFLPFILIFSIFIWLSSDSYNEKKYKEIS